MSLNLKCAIEHNIRKGGLEATTLSDRFPVWHMCYLPGRGEGAAGTDIRPQRYTV